MTIGPESFNNGPANSDDRFPSQVGQYRPSGRREAARSITSDVNADMSPRNGANMLDQRNGTSEPRKGSHDSRSVALDTSAPIASSIMTSKLGDAAMRDLSGLTEPVFRADVWKDQPVGSLVEHPLLRGLLMELPPKGAVPPPEYLDRWFEAARSILDLLYTMNARA